jgi:hypothetical protein
VNAKSPEGAEIIDQADELARRFEDYIPADDDRENVSTETRARLAALRNPRE